jgi:5-formyltetrahydrofolate cyclo-ligase
MIAPTTTGIKTTKTNASERRVRSATSRLLGSGRRFAAHHGIWSLVDRTAFVGFVYLLLRCSHDERPTAKTLHGGSGLDVRMSDDTERKRAVPAAGAAPATGAALPAKAALRSRLLAARSARPRSDRTADELALARHAGELTALAIRGADSWSRRDPGAAGPTIAAFLPVGAEPPITPLLDALAGDGGASILTPVLTADGDLDWAIYLPGATVSAGLRGTVAPDGPRLGVDALGQADLVLVPALAVDRRGHRLGRGGGSYDRALVRVRASVLVLAVVHDDELLDGVRDAVPVEPHDRVVDGAVTPRGVALFDPDQAS